MTGALHDEPGSPLGERPLMFYEDFHPGQVFDLGRRVLDRDDIVAFARVWDPQAMHLDDAAGERAGFGGVIASGWQTAALWMRLYVDGVLSRAAMLAAPGLDELRWLRPVTPGMWLRGRTTILETWASESRPGRGILRIRGEVLDDRDGAPVMTLEARGHVRMREGAGKP